MEDNWWKYLSQLLLTSYFILVCLNEKYSLYSLYYSSMGHALPLTKTGKRTEAKFIDQKRLHKYPNPNFVSWLYTSWIDLKSTFFPQVCFLFILLIYKIFKIFELKPSLKIWKQESIRRARLRARAKVDAEVKLKRRAYKDKWGIALDYSMR